MIGVKNGARLLAAVLSSAIPGVVQYNSPVQLLQRSTRTAVELADVDVGVDHIYTVVCDIANGDDALLTQLHYS